jgi:hypothetical protein
VFEETLITDDACHKDYRGSLRSSSKRAPNNPSPNGISNGIYRGFSLVFLRDEGKDRSSTAKKKAWLYWAILGWIRL